MDRRRGPAPVTEHGATMCARADVMAMPSRELGPRVGGVRRRTWRLILKLSEGSCEEFFMTSLRESRGDAAALDAWLPSDGERWRGPGGEDKLVLHDMEHAISVYPWVSPSEGSACGTLSLSAASSPSFRCAQPPTATRRLIRGYLQMVLRMQATYTTTATCMDRKPSHDSELQLRCSSNHLKVAERCRNSYQNKAPGSRR